MMGCSTHRSGGGADALLNNEAVLSPEQFTFCKKLSDDGMAYLFDNWSSPGWSDDKKKAAAEQLMQCDSKYPGGLKAYVANAVALLQASAAGTNPLEGYTPTVPVGESVTAHTAAWKHFEDIGLKNVGSCVFAIVAGGLGERLGYNNIKLKLPAESMTEKTYIQYYIETILSFQELARQASGKQDLKLSLMLMTSDDTDSRTRAFLEEISNFGMADDQIVILKPEKVPSICNNEGKIAMDEDNHLIQTKPHGHGDVHQVLHQSGLIDRWLAKGVTHLFIFQDTNFFCLRSGLVGLGVSVSKKFAMNSICVPRKAKEAIGGICKLEAAGKPSLTINVEYNQIDALLKSTAEFKAGDVPDSATGLSPFPGSINELIFDLNSYAKVLHTTGGLVPEFVNPKYADASKTTFLSPTRLECMMQDFPKSFTNNEKVGFTALNRPTVRQYSPVKNKTDDAAKKQASGLDPACAAAGEFDVYRFNMDCLNAGGSGMKVVGDSKALVFDGITVQSTPYVVLAPGFVNNISQKVQGGSIGHGSTLVIEGSDVTLENITITPGSCLVVKAAPGCSVTLKDLTVENAGWEIIPLTEAEKQTVSEELRIRGFKVVKHEAKTLTYDEPARYVNDQKTKPAKSKGCL